MRFLPGDFEWNDAKDLPDARIHRGREAVAAHSARWWRWAASFRSMWRK
jgi:hypothetical protein